MNPFSSTGRLTNVTSLSLDVMLFKIVLRVSNFVDDWSLYISNLKYKVLVYRDLKFLGYDRS
jgi:hypothetical protein